MTGDHEAIDTPTDTSDGSELEAERAHLARAFHRLEATRDEAIAVRSMVEVGRGGTQQARWEREVIHENIANRLAELELGDRSLAFGRIDQDTEAGGGSFVVGRIAVSDDDAEPLVVDWRAPVAEPFYRATGRDPHGLVRRRHFVSRGRTLVDLEDEFFGAAAGSTAVTVDGRELRGGGALVAALQQSRTGRLGDIVATIQGEQDEIIRAELPGVLVVQGGPGTGKTVVALHRAAYLLYTHRFPLEGQGVLVVGPNRLFLNYIEQVLPSLGESGVQLAVLADLLGGTTRVQGRDRELAARVKGDLAMARVIRRAVRDRQRPLTRTAEIPLGSRILRLTPSVSERIVAEARRRFDTHNAAVRHIRSTVLEALVASHPHDLEIATVREDLADEPAFRELLERLWPALTPAELLHDLFGSTALLRSATPMLDDDERAALFRAREPEGEVRRRIWTADDVPLLDEAREVLGGPPRSKKKREERPDDEVRTYGHIVVDEAQDLSPMQLRMLTRRSLNGSMTIVGDIAQSTGAWAHAAWSEVLDHLPDRHDARRIDLTVGYRIPGPLMAPAIATLTMAAPDLTPPVAVRGDGDPPTFVDAGADPERILVDEVRRARDVSDEGNVAVVVPESQYDDVVELLTEAGLEVGRGPRDGLDRQISVVPVGLVKGLEVDTTVVVDPAAIVAEESQGARALYVALTRSTQRLSVVHDGVVPPWLADMAEATAASAQPAPVFARPIEDAAPAPAPVEPDGPASQGTLFD